MPLTMTDQRGRANLYASLVILCAAPLIAALVTSQSAATSIAIVVGVVIFIGSFISVPFALYVLIFATLLSPEFGSRSTSGSGVTVRLDDFLLLVIGFSQLTRAAINRDVGLFVSTPLNRPITYYMVICIVSTVIGMIFGRVRPLTGFFFVLKYFQYFIVYFMLMNNLHSVKQAKGFLYAILATAAIVSVVAMAQIPSGGRVVAPFEGDDGEPNTLGGYLVLIISLVGGLLLTKGAITSLSGRLALIGLGGLTLVPLAYTLSRASWLAAIPAFLLLMVLGERKMIVGLMAAAAIIAFPYIMPESVEERLLYTVEEQDSAWARSYQEEIMGITFDTSSSARIRSWKAALSDFPNHPILGYGVTGWRFIDAQYLRVLLETGIAGFVCFCLLVGRTLRLAWRARREVPDPLLRGVALGFFIGTIAMLCHALMANTFIIVRVMEPFWLIAGIVVASPELTMAEEGQDADDPGPEPGTRKPATFPIRRHSPARP